MQTLKYRQKVTSNHPSALSLSLVCESDFLFIMPCFQDGCRWLQEEKSKHIRLGYANIRITVCKSELCTMHVCDLFKAIIQSINCLSIV